MNRLICLLVLLGAVTAPANEIIDYLEKLDAEFTRSVIAGPVRITARPRLIEREFAAFANEQLARKAARQEIIKAWMPKYEALQREGYVFHVEFLLLNQNLDANVEVPLAGDLRRHIMLINSKGETGLAYKIVSDSVASLDFMYPKKALTCYFNTVNRRGVPLLRNGIVALKLVVAGLGPAVPDTTLSWNVPLFYGDVPRPHVLSSRFGPRVFRTLVPLRSNVYNHVEFAPTIPHVSASPAQPAASRAQ